jgi:CrcB protein
VNRESRAALAFFAGNVVCFSTGNEVLPRLTPKPLKNADDFYHFARFGRFTEENTMDSCWNVLAVGAGGAVGASARYLMGFLPVHPRSGFPLTTLVINVLGAFCIGILAALAAKNHAISPRMLLFLKVGVCGGFTTFSTFSLETAGLLQNGHTGTAAAYVICSVLACVGAVFGAQAMIH